MKHHLRYLQRVQHWTPDECRDLVSEYHVAMETDEGFAAIEAHLASVTSREVALLAATGDA
ncbi:MAG: hypothetical protein REI94_10275 [Moraxellaceae bacterium]|nr:hypothetical protein [Moraxellaceae bacterium]